MRFTGRIAPFRKIGAVLLGALVPALPVAAQQRGQGQVVTLFSANATGPQQTFQNPVLRPNVTQELATYVRNATAQPKTVTLDLVSGGQTIASQVVTLAGNEMKRVLFGKPPTPDQAPRFREIAEPLTVRILESKDVLQDEQAIRVGWPRDYIADPEVSFTPQSEDGARNVLRVRLRLKNPDRFMGPPCRVELVLVPSRINGLLPQQGKTGTYAGYLSRDNPEVYLSAEELQFDPRVTSRRGPVYLTIDGYERAFTFDTTFAAAGRRSSAERIDRTMLRIEAPAYALPAPKLAVGLEIDNSSLRSTGTLSLGSTRNGRLAPLELRKVNGDRREVLQAVLCDLQGMLVLKPAVSSWLLELNTEDIIGRRVLRAQVLNAEKKPETVLDARTGETTTEVLQEIVLDGSKPRGVAFVGLPRTLPLGSGVVLNAVGSDPESGIRRVVFFVGRISSDGKLPVDSVEGRPVATAPGTWSAALPVSTDHKGPLHVGVQFTNGVGLSTTHTGIIELVEPPPPAPVVKEQSIEGTVFQGDFVEPGVEVGLYDAKGMAKATTKTDDAGKYIFKKVPPGTYTVLAIRTSAGTRGRTTVELEEGQKKTGVDIKLWK